MAVVLKRNSELEKIKKKIERREKIEKITLPVRKVLYKTLFCLFTLCVLYGAGSIGYSIWNSLWSSSTFVSICLFIVVFVISIFIEIQAWNACKIKEKKKKDVRVIGADGEKRVSDYIEKNFSNESYLLNDINIRCNGRSSQFDHILIGPGGIFCLETKNYSGKYHVENNQWVFFNGKERKYIDSPQEQSCYHVSVLSELLYTDRKSMVPLVVFANKKAKFEGDNKPCPVIYVEELKKEVSSYRKLYSKKEVEKIAKKIMSLDVGISKYQEKKKIS